MKFCNRYYLVTARHVIGENHKPPAERIGKRLSGVDLDLWLSDSVGNHQHIGLDKLSLEFKECEDDNDLAISSLNFSGRENFLTNINSFDFDDFATENQLFSDYEPSMPVFMCGFPPISPLLPQTENSPLPLMRQGIFASPPGMPLAVPDRLGSNYGYIDGYAIGGMSGSPVLVPQIGFPGQSPLGNHPFVPRRIVGMIIGRVDSSDEKSAGTHSGLSYYVDSQAIRKVLQQFAGERS